MSSRQLRKAASRWGCLLWQSFSSWQVDFQVGVLTHSPNREAGVKTTQLPVPSSDGTRLTSKRQEILHLDLGPQDGAGDTLEHFRASHYYFLKSLPVRMSDSRNKQLLYIAFTFQFSFLPLVECSDWNITLCKNNHYGNHTTERGDFEHVLALAVCWAFCLFTYIPHLFLI